MRYSPKAPRVSKNVSLAESIASDFHGEPDVIVQRDIRQDATPSPANIGGTVNRNSDSDGVALMTQKAKKAAKKGRKGAKRTFIANAIRRGMTELVAKQAWKLRKR
jgi:hypothetical protein